MPSKVSVNGLTVVHAKSGGVTIAFPDVCKTPAPPAPPLPIPYPNIAKSSDSAETAKTVKCDGQPVCVKDSNFMVSTGDEAGSLMGVASNKVKGKAEFVNFSFDVRVEGKNVPRAFDPMLHNDKNTPPAPLIQPPLPAVPAPLNEDCSLCGETRARPSGNEGAGGSGGVGGGSDRDALSRPAAASSGAEGVSGVSGPSAGSSSRPAATQSRIVSVEWRSEQAWCSDTVRFSGDVEGEMGTVKAPATIRPVGGGNPHQAETTVHSGYHLGMWTVKDVLPPHRGGRMAPDQNLQVSVAGTTSTKPLVVRFVTDVPRREHAEGYHRFSISAENQRITINTDVKFVPGWGAEIVQLGEAVPEETGGLLEIQGFRYSGYRWMRRRGRLREFWDGAAWQALPQGFDLNDRNHICVGFYRNGNVVESIYGASWPEAFPPWDVNAPDKQRKLRQWVDTIESTWTGKFDLKRQDCQSVDPGCCRYPIEVKARFIQVQSLSDGVIILADKNIRSNTSLFFIDDADLAMVAHEIGHYLGNPDEYAGARLDTSLNDDGARQGLDPDSIMGQNMTVVKKRHFRVIATVFAQAVAAKYGRRFAYGPKAV